MRRMLARLRAMIFRGRAEAEMRREMQSHLGLIEEGFERRGLDAGAARRAAALSYGSTEAAAESHRDARGFAHLENLWRDTRLAARALWHAPGFTAAAVLTLTLGLGGTIAVFTVINAVILEPLPYPAPNQLVALRQQAPGMGTLLDPSQGLGLSPSMYVTYGTHNHSFSSMGIWTPDKVAVQIQGREPQQAPVVEMSDGVLEALAVPPALGRWLLSGDFDPHGAPTVMLDYGYWQRAWGGAPGVLGQALLVNGGLRTIVGVMPRGFRVMDQTADLYIPMAIAKVGLRLGGFCCQGIGRLRAGATAATADADLQRLLPAWMDSWRNCPTCDGLYYESWHIREDLLPLKQQLLGTMSGVLWAVMGTLALLMLIAAGNVANLFLVRADARQHELTVRTALGAGRGRIAQCLLLESVLVALAGGGLGMVLATGAVRWLQAAGPTSLPRLSEVAVDGRVVAFGVALALLTGLLAGLAPTWKLNTARLAQVLSSESRSASGSRERRRLRRALSVAQMALALVLVLGAGLLLRSVAAMRQVAPGFSDASTLQTFHIAVPSKVVPDETQAMRTENDLLNRLAAIPGVRQVGLAEQLPMEDEGTDWDIVVKKGTTITPGTTPPSRRFSFVTPGYFAALGTAFEAGRDFTWTDIYGGRPYCLISENLARELWGSPQAALGQQLSPSGDPNNWDEVIGVVGDMRHDGVAKAAPATVYWPALAMHVWGPTFAQRNATVVLRTARTGNESLQSDVRRAVAAVNPEIPVGTYRSMQTIYDRSLAIPDFTMVVLGMAGVMALGLGLVGVYGVIAYDAAQRRREVSIRMALGASRGQVRGIFARQAVVVAGLGIPLGLVAAAGLSEALSALLFGVGRLDPVTFVLAPLLLLGAALAAGLLAARRATTVEASAALKG